MDKKFAKNFTKSLGGTLLYWGVVVLLAIGMSHLFTALFGSAALVIAAIFAVGCFAFAAFMDAKRKQKPKPIATIYIYDEKDKENDKA